MKDSKIYLIFFILFYFSCKENNAKYNANSQLNQKPIPVMETGKESSLAKVWIDSETGHRIEKLVEGQKRLPK